MEQLKNQCPYVVQPPVCTTLANGQTSCTVAAFPVCEPNVVPVGDTTVLVMTAIVIVAIAARALRAGGLK